MLNRRDAETLRENQLTEKIIGCGIEVYKALGLGLLESAYETGNNTFGESISGNLGVSASRR